MNKLPYCIYPTAAEQELHGLQVLPASLPIVNLDAAQKFRSSTFNIVSTETFKAEQIKKLVKLMADSFAINEPMARHLIPPKETPHNISGIRHKDPYGNDEFGEWTKANILYWIFRLFFLTESESPLDEIRINHDVVRHSLAAVNKEGEITGGAINIILASPDNQPFRNNDPFMNNVLTFFQPVYNLLSAQMNLSLKTLCDAYPDFSNALMEGNVGDLNLIARSPLLSTTETFELMAATIERFQQSGIRYLIVSAANQWTGAACEVLDGVRVHFFPFRLSKKVAESKLAMDDVVSSPDGFVSDKDSGCMVYIIRLK